MPRPGEMLAGKYRLLSELGKGGMGSVWCAEHLVLQSRVALKLIEPTRATTEEGAAQFLREARMAASLNSQHVVKIFDYGLAGANPFIAMELLDGETLRQRLQRVGPLQLEEVQKVVRQVAFGVERAHQAGIVHRDLKPDNIFIVKGEETELIKVLDFGIAKSLASSLLESIPAVTPTGALLGTPHYMSPEQATGSKSLDQRTDVWSLGVITCEALLGHTPFRGDTLGALIVSICSLPLPVPSERGAVPAGFDAWFRRACAREPSERFSSIREMSEAFAQLQAYDPPAASPLTPAESGADRAATPRSPRLHATRTAAISTTVHAPTRAEPLPVAELRRSEATGGAPFERTMSAAELSPRGRRGRLGKWALLALLLAAGAVSGALWLRSGQPAAAPPVTATAAAPSAPVSPPLSAAPLPSVPVAPVSPSESTSALEPRPKAPADAPPVLGGTQPSSAAPRVPRLQPERPRPSAEKRAKSSPPVDTPAKNDASDPRRPPPGGRPEDPYNLGF